MNRSKNKLIAAVTGLCLCAALAAPGTSAAATVRASADALALTPTTALFTVDFDFIAGTDAPYRIPIGARYGTPSTTSPYLGFTLRSQESTGSTTPSNANGIVLSSQPVADGEYVIPADQRASFTLVALVTVPAATEPTQYDLTLSHLPYYDGESRTTVAEPRLARFSAGPVLLNGPLIRIQQLGEQQ